MLIRAKKYLLSLLLLLSVTACANSALTVQRYNLPDSQAGAAISPATAKQILVIGNIQLAEFLDSESIVLQLDDITVHQAREHLWAENLTQQLRRGLRHRLSAQLPETLVVSDQRGISGDSWELQLAIDQFHGYTTGSALTSGQWQLHNPQGELVLIAPITVETALSSDGYPALVRALGNNLDQLAQQLAQQIRQQY